MEKKFCSKKNMNQTYHLQYHEGHLPTVAWESSLRDFPAVKPPKKLGTEELEEEPVKQAPKPTKTASPAKQKAAPKAKK